MSAEDETAKALRLWLEPKLSEVIPPKRNRHETTMAMAQRYDPSFKPTATTIRGREREAGQRIIEIYAEREAAMTSPPSDEEEITADRRLDSSQTI